MSLLLSTCTDQLVIAMEIYLSFNFAKNFVWQWRKRNLPSRITCHYDLSLSHEQRSASTMPNLPNYTESEFGVKNRVFNILLMTNSIRSLTSDQFSLIKSISLSIFIIIEPHINHMNSKLPQIITKITVNRITYTHQRPKELNISVKETVFSI